MKTNAHPNGGRAPVSSSEVDDRSDSSPAPTPATHPVPLRGKPLASRMTDERCIGRFNDYEGFLACLRARAAELQIATSGHANVIAGLPDKYLQKILGPNPVRRVGMTSLGGVLGILGAELWLVESPKAFRQFTSRIPKRDERLVRTTAKYVTTRTRRHYQKIGRNGGSRRRDNMPPADRVLASRKAANARWANTTAEQRSEIGRNLVRARWSKRARAARQRRRQAAANRGAHP
jgi:hypothetical protein